MRDQVVNQVLADVAYALAMSKQHYDASADEEHVIHSAIGHALLPDRPQATPLSYTRIRLQAKEIEGNSARKLRELFEPSWSSKPSRTVADWLKVADDKRLLRARALLRDLGDED